MTLADYAAALARRCVDAAGRSWGLHLERFAGGRVPKEK